MAIKGYKFYIRPVTDPESEWVAVNNIPQEDPDYTFTNLVSGVEYEIASVAVDFAGNESEMSVPLDVTTLVHNAYEDPMSDADASAVDSIVNAFAWQGKGTLLSISGPKGHYSKAYGHDYTAAGAAGRALTLDDKMHYGSTTKMNTAWLIFRQIDAGHLSLDDTIDRWPTLVGVTNSDRVTIKMLLMNRSGVYECMGPDSPFGQSSYLHPTVAGDAIAAMQGKPSAFEPGTQYAYCNGGWILLGEVLRQLDIEYGTSRSLPDIFQQDCYDALELTNCEWRRSPYMTAPYSRGWTDNLAYPTVVAVIQSLPLYWLLGAVYWALAPSLSGGWPTTPTYEFTAYDPSYPSSAGCLDGTIGDLRKWGEALRDSALLSPESIQLRDEVYRTSVVYTKQYDFDGPGWIGAGLGLTSIGDWRGWNGASAGYSSALWYNVTNGAVIAIMHNYFNIQPFSMMLQIAYNWWPESLDHNPTWIARMIDSGIDSGASEFGTGTLWPWHATGDANGATALPHDVPFYL